jgi:hypothetical protein
MRDPAICGNKEMRVVRINAASGNKNLDVYLRNLYTEVAGDVALFVISILLF